ncbi:hypothetical protein [Herbaspirillum sp.]|jgi:hypothetical protein|nr:hypothetical protein [Herbaspirillum sp.]MCP3654394.1 hypothetical protein [Herbaspirillum sp.]MCP3946675.1 hypothetical protein [Herbaspirillum sp.]MCP4031523.1 hypothetical protein [Herbaspirillum sp.]MCP4555983.1 hypothetical protein [Herbaspirillum sp.]
MEQELDLLLSKPEADAAASVGPGCEPPAPMTEELVLEAKRQITFRCGKSSITLYPNGKIALRGEYILSDAEGLNRIVGGQVELN